MTKQANTQTGATGNGSGRGSGDGPGDGLGGGSGDPKSDRQSEKNRDLVSRYVAAVRRRLPARAAGDISAELREAVASQLEAKEAELGRPATRDEMAVLLRSFGSPMLAEGAGSGPTLQGQIQLENAWGDGFNQNSIAGDFDISFGP